MGGRGITVYRCGWIKSELSRLYWSKNVIGGCLLLTKNADDEHSLGITSVLRRTDFLLLVGDKSCNLMKSFTIDVVKEIPPNSMRPSLPHMNFFESLLESPSGCLRSRRYQFFWRIFGTMS